MAVSEPESPVLQTPKWLEALENKRKKPHRLAHEIGSGSPCLLCKEKCKGLNLHFWRKICIECKCRKEDHDVEEEEDYAQFEILFGAKKVKRTTVKYNAQNKMFDWIPPNVPQDLAVDYLKALPQSKLPLSNSDGAKYRKQQLEKQLPLHDVDPNACHDLTDKEMKEFDKYLDSLRNNVIGQGKILKYQNPQLYKENILTNGSPVSQMAINKDQKIVPKCAGTPALFKADKISNINHATSENVDAESFPIESVLKKESIDKNQSFSEHQCGISPHYAQSTKSSQANLDSYNNKLPGRNQILSSVANAQSRIPEILLPCPKPYLVEHISCPNEQTLNSSEISNVQGRISPLRTPSSFIQRKSPIFDKQNNNAAIQQHDDNCNEKLESLPLSDALQHSFQPSNLVYSQNIGVHPDKIVPYQKPYEADTNLVSNFKGLNVSSSAVPFVPVQESGKIAGEKDVKERFNEIEKLSNEKKIKVTSPEKSTDLFPSPPQTCRQCYEMLKANDIVIQTHQAGESALWHARCFVCETCKELLVDLMYFFNKGKVYCGRHYAEQMNIPRCYACDELIFVKEYTVAEGESFHFRHFCCFHCDEPLGGKQYIPKDNHPVCLNCFQIKYGKNCHTCSQPIAAGDQRVGWKTLNFHVSPQCFRCTKCLKSLLGGKFVVKNDNTFCSKECVQEYGI